MEKLKNITLSHGSGGRLMHDLIRGLFVKELKNPFLSGLDDATALNLAGEDLLFTTDSYVVSPIFFPGGDIGKISICGTVNDLAVCGAKPLYIAIGMILEEGLDMDTLVRVTRSIGKAAKEAGVYIVTGDLKVVEKGSCDKIFITTSGIGARIKSFKLSLDRVREGDSVIISGPIGQHGVSILTAREELNLTSTVKSDCASLNGLTSSLAKAAEHVKFMRDPTRGGLATTLNEFTERKSFGIEIDEEKLPVSAGVRSACELLGFDPLYMANEGRAVIITSKKGSKKVLGLLKRHKQGRGARIIGQITKKYKGKVCLKTRAGGLRLVRMLTGEQLPRIC